MNHTTVLQQSDDVLEQEASGRLVLLHLESGDYYSLDGVGKRVWRLCGDGQTLEELKTQLTDEYEVEPKKLENDVSRFVRDLLSAELLVRRSSRNAAD